MARIITESFEHGSNLIFSNASTIGAPGVATAGARNGLYGLHFNNYNATAFAILPLGAAYIDGYHHFHLKCSTYAGLGALITWRKSGTTLGSLRLTAGRQLSVWVGTTKVATGSQVLTDGSWYNIQSYINIHSSTGDIQVKIDNGAVPDIDYSNQDTQPGADGDYNEIVFGTLAVLGGGVVFFDDYIFQDTTGGIEDSWVGIKNIYRAAPTGDSGTNNTWSRSTGSTGFPLVDEAPPNDTDYVYSTTNAQKQGHTFPSFSLPPGAVVKATMFSYVGKKITDGQFKIGCRSGTTESLGSAIDPGIDNSVHQTRFRLDPNTAAEWTTANAEAAESLVESVI